MNLTVTTICKDCGTSIKQAADAWPFHLKCEHCRDRDQAYTERGRQEEMGGSDYDA